MTYAAGSRIEGWAPGLQSLGVKAGATAGTVAYLNSGSGQLLTSDGTKAYGFLNQDAAGQMYVWKQATGATTGVEVTRYSKAGVLDATYKVT